MILFLIAAVLLLLLILVQRGRGGGLAGALGGLGGHSAFGTKTGDVFTKATAILAAIFIILAMVIGYLMHRGIGFREPAPAKAPSEPGEEDTGGKTDAEPAETTSPDEGTAE